MIIGIVEHGEVRIFDDMPHVMREWAAYPSDIESEVIVFYGEDGAWLKPTFTRGPRRWLGLRAGLDSFSLSPASAAESSALDAPDRLGLALSGADALAPNRHVKSLDDLKKRYPAPDGALAAPEGARYCFLNTNAGCGEIYDESGAVIYRYRPPASGLNFLNGLLRGPDFLLHDAANREVLRIERTRSFPKAGFRIVHEGRSKGIVAKRSVVGFDYTAEFDGAAWRFQIPLFTVAFLGESRRGSRVAVHLQSELNWFVFIPEADNNVVLLACLAFLHSERCRT